MSGYDEENLFDQQDQQSETLSIESDEVEEKPQVIVAKKETTVTQKKDTEFIQIPPKHSRSHSHHHHHRHAPLYPLKEKITLLTPPAAPREKDDEHELHKEPAEESKGCAPFAYNCPHFTK